MDSTQYLLQGHSYLGRKDYFSAIDSYKKALALQDKKIQDNTTSIYTHIATALTKLGQYKDAINNYTYAINYDQSISPAAYYGRGIVWMKILDFHKAIQDIDQSIKLSDNFALAYFCRATIYMELKKYAEAEKDYIKAIDLLNYLPPCALFLNGLGNAKYRLGEYDSALEYYNSAIEADPNFIAAYNNRGNTCLKLNQYQKAINDFKIAITLNPQKEKQYKWQWNFNYILPKFVDDIELYLTTRKLDEFDEEEFLIDILRLMKADKEDYSAIAKIILNSNNNLLEIIAADINNKDIYIELYFQVLKILSLLHVDQITCPISHYTSKITAQTLLLEGSSLRFSSIVNTNDEYEGAMLQLLLNFNQESALSTNAYIACFVVGEDDHNMFRLYGKTDNKENSGLCLCFDKFFFQ